MAAAPSSDYCRRDSIRAANDFRSTITVEKTVRDPDLEKVAPITSRLFDVSNERELRSILTSTSSNALATTRYWSTFEQFLANASAALQSGVRVIDIDTTNLHVPAGTAGYDLRPLLQSSANTGGAARVSASNGTRKSRQNRLMGHPPMV